MKAAALPLASAALLAGAVLLAWTLLRAPGTTTTAPDRSGKLLPATGSTPAPARKTRPASAAPLTESAAPAPVPGTALLPVRTAAQPTTPEEFAAQPVPARRTPLQPADGRPILPLAFEEPAPGSAALPPEIESALLHVQDNFLAAIGGENADPSTAEYSRRFFNAQRRADMELRARIGGQAFMSLLRARRDKELAEQAAGF